MRATEIFSRAIKLMDEQNEFGEAQWGDTSDYQNRAVEIINVLSNELLPFSDTYEVNEGKRPMCPQIASLNDNVALDDGLAGTVMPYGLAAELIKVDDPHSGNYFLQRYQELVARFSRTLPSAWDTPEDLYGAVEYCYGVRW